MNNNVEEETTYIVAEEKRHRGCIILSIIVVLFMVVALLTVPSEMEHRKELKGNIAEYVRNYANEELQKQDGLTFLLGNFMMKSDVIMETLIDRFFVIDIKNYGLFSLGYITIANKDESHLVSIGALGKVFCLLDYKDMHENMQEIKNEDKTSDTI